MTDVPLAVDAVGGVLRELDYPAAGWQVLVTADLAGADLVTLYHLAGLPPGPYQGLDDVLRALAGDAPSDRRTTTPIGGRR